MARTAGEEIDRRENEIDAASFAAGYLRGEGGHRGKAGYLESLVRDLRMVGWARQGTQATRQILVEETSLRSLVETAKSVRSADADMESLRDAVDRMSAALEAFIDTHEELP